MTNIEIRYTNHIALLCRSPLATHRENAQAIALQSLKDDRAKLAARPRKTEPCKSRHESMLAEMAALIARLEHDLLNDH